jgi:hypothetical protein
MARLTTDQRTQRAPLIAGLYTLAGTLATAALEHAPQDRHTLNEGADAAAALAFAVGENPAKDRDAVAAQLTMLCDLLADGPARADLIEDVVALVPLVQEAGLPSRAEVRARRVRG